MTIIFECSVPCPMHEEEEEEDEVDRSQCVIVARVHYKECYSTSGLDGWMDGG